MRRHTLVAPFLLAALLLPATWAGAQNPQIASKPIGGAGFAAIEWIFAMKDRDLFDAWAQHGAVGRLQGSVARYLDWPRVSDILVLYNGWHLRGDVPDARIQHIQDSLTRAAFGDRFKGRNPGGSYILLLRYKNSDRAVVVGFKDGVFLIEGADGLGAVDVRGAAATTSTAGGADARAAAGSPRVAGLALVRPSRAASRRDPALAGVFESHQ